jgi:isopentenyl diphosphate isomerase/L-lactate dehydrogenase-like FMN-dependent dehydrogenase
MTSVGIGRQRQADVYLGALTGAKRSVPVDPAQLEEGARRRMSQEAFAYIAGGAGLEETMRANRAAFDRVQIVPRILHDVSTRDTSVELFGRRLRGPFLLAPIGVLEMAHQEADLAVAKAAAAEGVPMIFSNQASVPMERCAEAMGSSPRWFQLYWSTSNELVESLVGRAEACGCEAITVTLDTTVLGWRTRDLDLAYLPFLRGKGIAQYTSDPVFRRLVEEGGEEPAERRRPTLAALSALYQLTRAYPGSFLANLRSPHPRMAVRRFLEVYSRPSLTWSDLPFLRERTKLPILLKGVLHPDDARRALDEGIDGLVVSNHGGRQIDGEVATADALPVIAELVDGRIPVLLDSGVRGGADAFKALALGATAVLIGRPYAYGLAIGGERGVRDVIKNFLADFDLTMGLAGCASIGEISAESVAATS